MCSSRHMVMSGPMGRYFEMRRAEAPVVVSVMISFACRCGVPLSSRVAGQACPRGPLLLGAQQEQPAHATHGGDLQQMQGGTAITLTANDGAFY